MLASDLCQKTGWEILYRSQKSTIFREIFKGVIDFIEFESGSSIDLIVCNNEIFVLDFTKSDEDIENTFLVPFLWFRALDSDLTNYETYECEVPGRKIMLVGVDDIDEKK